MTAVGIDPYHQRVIAEAVASAVRVNVAMGRFTPQAAGFTKRRAVDLCRVAACLCPTL